MRTEAELKSYKFRSEREAEWKALEGLLNRVQSKGVKTLSREELLELPQLYRSAVSSLSTARAVSLDRKPHQLSGDALHPVVSVHLWTEDWVLEPGFSLFLS